MYAHAHTHSTPFSFNFSCYSIHHFQTNKERVNEVLLIFRTEDGDSDNKESACNVGDPILSLGWEDPLEEGVAIHSSILAWRIPWTETGGL